ncbi:2'-5' RNA ligase family protein [Nocardioides sp. DS6]|uniref:2'-5' RNA ligase family protein n=1 Tax=Nocardioides eburneus TaxID=3231482 RepID=A0ABV3T1L9_9ACTN
MSGVAGRPADRPADRPGHSVLVVPVPELDPFVQARTAHYDASFLSADPAFAHAHVTLLGHWLSDPAVADLDTVAQVLARFEPFETALGEVSAFPDGLVHLRPEPDAPFRALTQALVARFPQCPPYAGRFPDPVPHLTLDQTSEAVTVDSVAAELRGILPVRLRVDRVDLQWWANHDCHVRHTWKLGVSEVVR